MTTKIRITRVEEEPFSTPTRVILSQFCLLRSAKKVGDEEWVNNYQLGQLKKWNSHISYEVIDRH